MKYIQALSIAVIAATFPARAEQTTVAVTAAPNLSFAVPKGWQACDPETDKLLGSAPDPDGANAGVCKSYADNPQFKLGFFAPKLGETLFVTVTFRDTTRMTQAMLATLTTAQLSATAESLKPDYSAEMAKSGNKLDGIEARLDRLDGQLGLVTTTRQSKNGGGPLQFVKEQWEVPFEGHLYTISFSWPVLVEAKVSPRRDALKASVKFTPE